MEVRGVRKSTSDVMVIFPAFNGEGVGPTLREK